MSRMFRLETTSCHPWCATCAHWNKHNCAKRGYPTRHNQCCLWWQGIGQQEQQTPQPVEQPALWE